MKLSDLNFSSVEMMALDGLSIRLRLKGGDLIRLFFGDQGELSQALADWGRVHGHLNLVENPPSTGKCYKRLARKAKASSTECR